MSFQGSFHGPSSHVEFLTMSFQGPSKTCSDRPRFPGPSAMRRPSQETPRYTHLLHPLLHPAARNTNDVQSDRPTWTSTMPSFEEGDVFEPLMFLNFTRRGSQRVWWARLGRWVGASLGELDCRTLVNSVYTHAQVLVHCNPCCPKAVNTVYPAMFTPKVSEQKTRHSGYLSFPKDPHPKQNKGFEGTNMYKPLL